MPVSSCDGVNTMQSAVCCTSSPPSQRELSSIPPQSYTIADARSYANSYDGYFFGMKASPVTTAVPSTFTSHRHSPYPRISPNSSNLSLPNDHNGGYDYKPNCHFHTTHNYNNVYPMRQTHRPTSFEYAPR